MHAGALWMGGMGPHVRSACTRTRLHRASPLFNSVACGLCLGRPQYLTAPSVAVSSIVSPWSA